MHANFMLIATPDNHLTVKRFLDSDVRHGDRSTGAGSAGDECDFAFKR